VQALRSLFRFHIRFLFRCLFRFLFGAYCEGRRPLTHSQNSLGWLGSLGSLALARLGGMSTAAEERAEKRRAKILARGQGRGLAVHDEATGPREPPPMPQAAAEMDRDQQEQVPAASKNGGDGVGHCAGGAPPQAEEGQSQEAAAPEPLSAAELAAQKREARRKRILASSSERMALVAGKRLSTDDGEAAKNDEGSEVAGGASAPTTMSAMRPPLKAKDGDEFDNPFEDKPEPVRKQRGVATAGNAKLKLDSDLIMKAKARQQEAKRGPKKSGGVAFWISLERVCALSLLILTGICIGLYLLPTARDLSALTHSRHLGESSSQEAALRALLGADDEHEWEGAGSDTVQQGAGQSTNVEAFIGALIEGAFDHLSKATRPLGYSCVPVGAIVLVQRVAVKPAFGALRKAIGYAAFPITFSPPADAWSVSGIVSKLASSVPGMRTAMGGAKALQSFMADVALVHVAMLVTLALGVALSSTNEIEDSSFAAQSTATSTSQESEL
jgi:hypothetical protein